jgi:Domain of unknown function (DUF4357)
MANTFQRPFSIKIFVPDGDPDGLRLIEKSNWTGLGVVFNRTNYKQVVSRPEFDRTGVYVLVGVSDDSALPTIYVGEGDPVKDRLNDHYSKKDFWDLAVFFVTKDNSLNKAHVQRMECRLLEFASVAKQCKLDNGNTPAPPTLSEAETADVDSFIVDMLSIFPLLGLGVFEKLEARVSLHELLQIESKGIRASGYEDAKGFVVCEGSQLAKDEVPSIHRYMSTLRNDLLQQGIIIARGSCFVFAQDQVFNSPSTAAGVVLGRTANGRIEWKTKEGVTLKQLQTTAASQQQ